MSQLSRDFLDTDYTYLLYKHGLDYRVHERGLHICIYQQWKWSSSTGESISIQKYIYPIIRSFYEWILKKMEKFGNPSLVGKESL